MIKTRTGTARWTRGRPPILRQAGQFRGAHQVVPGDAREGHGVRVLEARYCHPVQIGDVKDSVSNRAVDVFNGLNHRSADFNK